jgi:hypothetical protein
MYKNERIVEGKRKRIAGGVGTHILDPLWLKGPNPETSVIAS